jgi:hypothetical protein
MSQAKAALPSAELPTPKQGGPRRPPFPRLHRDGTHTERRLLAVVLLVAGTYSVPAQNLSDRIAACLSYHGDDGQSLLSEHRRSARSRLCS